MINATLVKSALVELILANPDTSLPGVTKDEKKRLITLLTREKDTTSHPDWDACLSYDVTSQGLQGLGKTYFASEDGSIGSRETYKDDFARGNSIVATVQITVSHLLLSLTITCLNSSRVHTLPARCQSDKQGSQAQLQGSRLLYSPHGELDR